MVCPLILISISEMRESTSFGGKTRWHSALSVAVLGIFSGVKVKCKTISSSEIVEA